MNKKRLTLRATLILSPATPMVLLVAFILATMLFFPAQGLANYNNLPTDSLVGPQSSIRILSLNVMQSADTPRAQRFATIVDYLNTHPPVHAMALQELSGGFFDEPIFINNNSEADLAGMLDGKYGYYTESSFGNPPFIAFKVGVMPRYTMDYRAATPLIPSGEYHPESFYRDFSGRANVVMCVMDIPGFGLVNLYSTHFYTGDSIQTQADNLMTFVDQVDQAHPSRATLVAGDLNFSLTSETRSIYDTFIKNGFADSYREVNPGDPGYTYGVSTNEFYTSGAPSRIDYLFVRGDDLQISNSQVVFDGVNGSNVSDHFGVLTEITPTPLPSSLLLLGSSLLGLAGLGYRRRTRT